MIKILGTDDAVNTCDCCGKTNLKATVVVEVDGEILHYGSVCATRHTGLSEKLLKQAIKSHEDGVKLQAKTEYEKSAAYLEAEVAIQSAHRQGLKPGKEFRDFTRPFTTAANEVKTQIASKYGLEPWQF